MDGGSGIFDPPLLDSTWADFMWIEVMVQDGGADGGYEWPLKACFGCAENILVVPLEILAENMVDEVGGVDGVGGGSNCSYDVIGAWVDME